MSWTNATLPTTNYSNYVVNSDVSQTYDNSFSYNTSDITYDGFYVSYSQTWNQTTRPRTSWV